MSRVSKAATLQQDQRKVYLDWANHHLKRGGHSETLSDLRDISNGIYLPVVIQTVVQGTVPCVHTSPLSEEQRRENNEQCVNFLQSSGVNCSTFTAKDISDGNMRSILSLFYSLSQYKKTMKSGSTSDPPSSSPRIRPLSPSRKNSHGVNKREGSDADQHLPPSRLARPTSPSLKATLGTNIKPASIIEPAPALSTANEPPSGLSNGIEPTYHNAGTGTSHKPSTLVIPETNGGGSIGPAHISPTGPSRRTAGSSILTTTSYDRPFAQRRVPYRPINILPSETDRRDKTAGVKAETDRRDKTAGVKAESAGTERDEREPPLEKITNGDTLSPLSSPPTSPASSQGGEANNSGATTRAQVSSTAGAGGIQGSPKSAPPQSGVAGSPKMAPPQSGPEVGSAPPGHSKTSPLLGSRLPAPRGKPEPSNPSVKDDAPEQSQSKLKTPVGATLSGSGGRSTPTHSLPQKSGLARPASRLTRPSTAASSSGEKGGAVTVAGVGDKEERGAESEVSASGRRGSLSGRGDASTDETGAKSEKLALKRKGSDGKAKRFGLTPPGASRLPHKGATSIAPPGGSHSRQEAGGKSTPADKSAATSSEELEASGGSTDKSSGDPGTAKTAPTVLAAPKRSLKKVVHRVSVPEQGVASGSVAGGDGESAAVSASVRTPNLPSGPGSETTPTPDARTTVAEKADSSPASSRLPNPAHKKSLTLPSGMRAPGLQSPWNQRAAHGTKTSGLARPTLKASSSSSSSVGAGKGSAGHTSNGLDGGDTRAAVGSQVDEKSDVSPATTESASERAPARSAPTEPKGVPGSKSGSIPPPLILKTSAKVDKTDEILSPPAAFSTKALSQGSTNGPQTQPQVSADRRIIPEDMPETSSSPSPRSRDPRRTGTNTAESRDPRRTGTNTAESSAKNLRNEREIEREDKMTTPTTDQTGVKPAPLTQTLSQPETGQLYSDSLPQLGPTPSSSTLTSSATPTPQSTPERDGLFMQSDEVRAGALKGRVGRLAEQPQRDRAKRARSLSPKSSHRVTAFEEDLHPESPLLRSRRLQVIRTENNDSVHSEGSSPVHSPAHKPTKSSLRYSSSSASSSPKVRHSSSSSLDSSKGHKVTISPRSSQLVYLPDEAPSGAIVSGLPLETPPTVLVGDRPTSLTESTCSSDSLSPPSSLSCSGGVAAPNRLKSSLVRRPSNRSTMSETLDYQRDIFLRPGTEDSSSEVMYGSTPELLESFENQLSTMRSDLEAKNRMLHIYENSMHDLSTKVHTLKRSLEEKDAEIKHLTEEKHIRTTWMPLDLEGRSLASRAGSDGGILSDGCLSDSAMDSPRDGKGGKKKRKWKVSKRFSFRKKAKEADSHELHVSADTESIMSSRSTAKSIRRIPSKSKPSDLVSISEYSPENRFRDLDTKSTYTLDVHSEYGGMSMVLPGTFHYSDEISVFEDISPGARTLVLLQIGFQGGHTSVSSEEERGEEEEEEKGGRGVERRVLGTLSVAPEVSWVTMDAKIGDIFIHYMSTLDPGCLGLSDESILFYCVGEERRAIGNALLPPITPYQALSEGGKVPIKIFLRGALHDSCDTLALKTLVTVDTIQSYVSMLTETQWLVVMGTKGTCKTSLATGLAHHLAKLVEGEAESEGVEEGGSRLGELLGNGGGVTTFNVDKQGLGSVLKFMKNELPRKMRMSHYRTTPILLLDNVYECQELEHVLIAAGTLPKRPYIIATLCSGTTRGVPLHQLLFHHQIRVITCNPQNEPILGILSRSLRKRVYQLKASSDSIDPVAERLLNWLPYLLEHLNSYINKFHSNNVALGPRVFMGCPIDQPALDTETWFINLWNHFLIPYLMGAIMAGIETYTADPHLEWMDVREWVVETYPWQSAVNVMKLRTLVPEDVGWNHAVRPQQSRLMIMKEESKLSDDTRSMLRMKQAA